jgi:hypothetical protein
MQVHPLYGDILGKITGIEFQTSTPHLVYAFYCQKAYLAVGQSAGMGIAD